MSYNPKVSQILSWLDLAVDIIYKGNPDEDAYDYLGVTNALYEARDLALQLPAEDRKTVFELIDEVFSIYARQWGVCDFTDIGIDEAEE